jgi:ribosome-associated toxin RatA of RatAB toxin-antitoxin module
MRTQIAIDVSAPPQRVFELSRDVARWPELLPHYRTVTVQSRTADRVVARMAAVRPGRVPIPVWWHAEQWSDPSDASDLRLHFRHVGGVTRGMTVTWHIRPRDGGARVTIEHDFSRRLPLLGPNLLPRLVEAVRLYLQKRLDVHWGRVWTA